MNPFKAVVPLLPIALLFAQPLWAWYVPALAWLAPAKPLAGIDPTTQATGTAILIGTFVAALSAPRRAARAAVAFFDGAGFAYGHVVSLIVVAAAVSEGIVRNGLIASAAAALGDWPAGMTLLSVALPWAWRPSPARASARPSPASARSPRSPPPWAWTRSASAPWSPSPPSSAAPSARGPRSCCCARPSRTPRPTRSPARAAPPPRGRGRARRGRAAGFRLKSQAVRQPEPETHRGGAEAAEKTKEVCPRSDTKETRINGRMGVGMFV